MSPDHPMVQYLHSLRTQDAAANPSYVEESRRPFLAQLRREFAWFPTDEQLRVSTKLDGLIDALVGPTPPVDLVVLTGDAGDGKTAVCVQLWNRLQQSRELRPIDEAGGWVIVKDASEVDEQKLREMLLEHLVPSPPTRLLLAINEGRLRRLLRDDSLAPDEHRARATLLWSEVIQPSLDVMTDRSRAAELDAAMRRRRVAVVNFRHRMHIDAVTGPLLDQWTKPAWWEDSPVCRTCPAFASCPIVANVRDLRERPVQQRLVEVLGRAHHAGQRVPFRRLQGVLALTCTGGLRCEHVRPGGVLAREDQSPIARLQHRWYQALWGSTGPVPFRPEPIALALAGADPGKEASIEVDRILDDLLASPDEEQRLPRPLGPLEREAVAYARQFASVDNPSVRPTEELTSLTRTLRRWHGLSGEGVATTWRESLALLSRYATSGEEEPLRARIVEALNRLHRQPGTRTETLTSRQLDPMAFRRHERHALELDLGVEFAVRLRRGPLLPALVGEWLEGRASEIELLAWPVGTDRERTAELRIDTNLLEALLSVCEGFTFMAALGPYRRELARFHARLGALAVEAGHRPQVLLRVDGKAYRVQASDKKLRFEAV